MLPRMGSLIDRAGLLAARLGMVMLAVIAGLLFFEVAARYLFNAPTKWTQDVSITLQIWMTFLAMAFVLKNREMIRITVVTERLGARANRVLDGLSLLVILGFSALAIRETWRIAADSIALGRRQPTMLEMPNWVNEVALVIGFSLLAIQAAAELVRVAAGRTEPPSPTAGHGETAERR